MCKYALHFALLLAGSDGCGLRAGTYGSSRALVVDEANARAC
jgi:hypothetical protein